MGRDISEITEPVVFYDKKLEVEKEIMEVMMKDMNKNSIINIFKDLMTKGYQPKEDLETYIENMKDMDIENIKDLLRIKQEEESQRRRSKYFGPMEEGV